MLTKTDGNKRFQMSIDSAAGGRNSLQMLLLVRGCQIDAGRQIRFTKPSPSSIRRTPFKKREPAIADTQLRGSWLPDSPTAFVLLIGLCHTTKTGMLFVRAGWRLSKIARSAVHAKNSI